MLLLYPAEVVEVVGGGRLNGVVVVVVVVVVVEGVGGVGGAVVVVVVVGGSDKLDDGKGGLLALRCFFVSAASKLGGASLFDDICGDGDVNRIKITFY